MMMFLITVLGLALCAVIATLGIALIIIAVDEMNNDGKDGI